MDKCLCCGTPLLRHIRCQGVYGYCSHCRQEMPNVAEHCVSVALAPLPLKALGRSLQLADAVALR